jgi:hypothetical protein
VASDFDFDNKTFRIVRNDGPGTEVTTETVFHYRQVGNIVHADYFGGGVQVGKLVGILEGDTIRHSYIQVNLAGEFNAGHSIVEVRRSAEGRLQMIDRWEWESKTGQGLAVFEEIEG